MLATLGITRAYTNQQAYRGINVVVHCLLLYGGIAGVRIEACRLNHVDWPITQCGLLVAYRLRRNVLQIKAKEGVSSSHMMAQPHPAQPLVLL